MRTFLDDYMDADVAYLAGLVIARGNIMETAGTRQLTITFPFSSLRAQGIQSTFDQETYIRLGLSDIRERLLNLLDTDVSIVRRETGVDFVIRFLRNSLGWRDIMLLTGGATSYAAFHVPSVFFDSTLPQEWKREFVRGYADVAGNIRHSNRYVDGRHRVRLDALNYPTNWEIPVELCRLLQEHLEVPVQLITWGHPNMGREFREHQINIFAKAFLRVGFTFEHKQRILEEFAGWDEDNTKAIDDDYCPGSRRLTTHKPGDPAENEADKLDQRLAGHHFDAYWQICKRLGCTRMPLP
ncbi:MAG: hypothetical protein FJY85_23545, partial [Deltaproteobacteria bacterium]|nr:hypothetical protein [Deltaproteobacteria bacterium]